MDLQLMCMPVASRQVEAQVYREGPSGHMHQLFLNTILEGLNEAARLSHVSIGKAKEEEANVTSNMAVSQQLQQWGHGD